MKKTRVMSKKQEITSRLETKSLRKKSSKIWTKETVVKKSLAKSITTLGSLKGKTVLVSVDYNVSIQDGKVTSDRRIKESIPTLQLLLSKGAQLLLVSHLGRPNGIDPSLSLRIVLPILKSYLNMSVGFLETPTSPMPKDKVVLCENIRFFPGEEKNSLQFARQLATYADLYVNDAFGTAHRAGASNNAITKLLPSYTGLLMQKEIQALSRILYSPKRPLVTIIGFAKISDKLEILQSLLEVSDKVLIGGAVAFTFLRALGVDCAKSLVDEASIPLAKKMLRKYDGKMILPLDFVCATSLDSSHRIVCDADKIPALFAGYDIGPATIELFSGFIKGAKTVFWNGPVGVFEHPPYDVATNKLAQIVANPKIISIVGGGDTASAMKKASVTLTHISTGGGASIAFFEKKPLPSLHAIAKSK